MKATGEPQARLELMPRHRPDQGWALVFTTGGRLEVLRTVATLSQAIDVARERDLPLAAAPDVRADMTAWGRAPADWPPAIHF